MGNSLENLAKEPRHAKVIKSLLKRVRDMGEDSVILDYELYQIHIIKKRAAPKQAQPCIVVDASVTGGNPGHTECRGIDKETGEILFSEQIGIATNNVGEWLGICYAIAHQKGGLVYSDSKIAINWAYQKTCKTNIFEHYPKLASRNPELSRLIAEGIEILHAYDYKVLWWNKKAMGKENPADYGRKKSWNT